MLKVFIISAIILLIAISGLIIRIILDRKAEFNSGNCAGKNPGLKQHEISCGCEISCKLKN
jgi:hypothetical protein